MRGKFCLYFALLVFAATVLSSCEQIINYPAPTLNTLSPTSVNAGQSSFNLTVVGSNLTPASIVYWNAACSGSNTCASTSGIALTTLFQSTGSLQATIPADLIINPATVSITITTPAPGGGVSLPLTFTVNPVASPLPKITSVTPTTVLANSGAFTLDILGSNFESQSSVSINGAVEPSTFESATTLEVSSVPAAFVNNAGEMTVVVTNPPPSGGSSNAATVTVANPVPTISKIAPTSVQAGSGNTTLTVTGTSFASNAVILINGAQRQTIVSSATSVGTQLTAADFVNGGVTQVQVMNPSPGGGTSNILPLGVSPTDSAGLPILVDLAPNGTQANSGVCGGPVNCTSGAQGLTLTTSGPSVNHTGEYVVFASVSSNLLLNQTNPAAEIFLRDTCLGASSCTPNTFAVSISAGGGLPNGPSSEPSLDVDGTDLAYTSSATNLVNYVNVPVGTPYTQVYWQPGCAGSTGPCTLSTTTSSSTGTTGSTGTTTTTATPVLVSIAADNVNPGNGNSYNPSISADGRYVAFVSLATNLVSGIQVDGITPQVYLRDTCTGVTPLTQSGGSCIPVTYLVSSPDGITPGNGPSAHPAVANLGGYVAFQSSATNLQVNCLNTCSAGSQEIFEQNECQITTIGCVPTIQLISSPDGTTPAGTASSEPAISFDGRFVAFATAAQNLGYVTNGIQQVYVRDTCNNFTSTISTITTCTPQTYLVSTASTGNPSVAIPGNDLSENPSINENSTGSGQFVAFASRATNLGANIANGVENIFVRDTCLTVVTTTSVCAPGLSLASQASGSNPPAANGNSVMPSISADGHTVAFLSFASDLVPLDTNALEDIFLGTTSF